MDLSVGTIAALATAAVGIIAAVAAGIVSIITAWRTIVTKVSAIEGHVNSEKTAAAGREATLTRENQLLREMLAERTTTAALLAQAAANKSVGTP
jgi:hypothetical protein